MVFVYDTHSFLFELNYSDKAKGHKVIFEDREGREKEIILEKIEIKSSAVSCKLYDTEGNKYLIPIFRVIKVYKDDELVWDNSDIDRSNVKVIKGYE